MCVLCAVCDLKLCPFHAIYTIPAKHANVVEHGRLMLCILLCVCAPLNRTSNACTFLCVELNGGVPSIFSVLSNYFIILISNVFPVNSPFERRAAPRMRILKNISFRMHIFPERLHFPQKELK